MTSEQSIREKFATQIAQIAFGEKYNGTTMYKSRIAIAYEIPLDQEIKFLMPWDYDDLRLFGRFLTQLWGMIIATEDYIVWSDRNGRWKGKVKVSDIDKVYHLAGPLKHNVSFRAHAKTYDFGSIRKDDAYELAAFLRRQS